MSCDNDSLVRLMLQRRNGPGLPGLGLATARQYARYLRRLGRLLQGRRGGSSSNIALPDYMWLLQPRAVAACIEAGRGRAGYYSACYAALFSLCLEGEHAAALALYKERAALANAPLVSERSALANRRSARQQRGWCSAAEVQGIRDYWRARACEGAPLAVLQAYSAVCCYTLLPPVRGDWGTVVVVLRVKDSAAANWLVDGGVNAQGGLHTGTDGSAAGTAPTPLMAVTWRRFKTAKFGLAPAQQLLSEELKGAIRTLVAATRAAA